jgi:hypothetical protein
MVVAAAETTTRAVVTTMGTKWCPAEAEATVHVPATLKAAAAAAKVPAETPTTCSGTAECPATKIGAAVLPGNKSCKGKKLVPAVAGKPLFSHLSSLFSSVAYGLGRAVLMT